MLSTGRVGRQHRRNTVPGLTSLTVARAPNCVHATPLCPLLPCACHALITVCPPMVHYGGKLNAFGRRGS